MSQGLGAYRRDGSGRPGSEGVVWGRQIRSQGRGCGVVKTGLWHENGGLLLRVIFHNPPKLGSTVFLGFLAGQVYSCAGSSSWGVVSGGVLGWRTSVEMAMGMSKRYLNLFSVGYSIKLYA